MIDWSKFFQIPDDVTIWRILDSQFLASLLAAGFGLLLLRYEWKLRDAQEEARAAEEALRTREEVDRKEIEQEDVAIAAEPVVDTRPANRQEAKKLIDSAKKYLEDTGDADLDGRHRRTYRKISGHYPEDLALALRDRRQISDTQFDAAFSLFTKSNKFFRGRAARRTITDADLEEFRRLHDDLVKTSK